MTVRGAVERSCLCRVCEYECMTETLRQWDRTEMNFISHEAGRLHVRFALDRHCRGFRNSQFTLLSTTTTSTNPKPIPLEAHAPPQHLILRALPYFPRRRPCIKTVSPFTPSLQRRRSRQKHTHAAAVATAHGCGPSDGTLTPPAALPQNLHKTSLGPNLTARRCLRLRSSLSSKMARRTTVS